jgi:hypothetical protein
MIIDVDKEAAARLGEDKCGQENRTRTGLANGVFFMAGVGFL